MTMDQLLKKLKKKVDQDGLREVGKLLDIDHSTISLYLSGKRKPTGEITLKMLEKLP